MSKYYNISDYKKDLKEADKLYVLVKPKWTLLIGNFHTQPGSCHH